MSLYSLSPKDILQPVPPVAGLRIEESTDIDLLAAMGSTTPSEVTRRMTHDHIAFAAFLDDVPAAFGWMARGRARIGELNHELVLPSGNRYLWNFRTMPGFRGRGIYPALLQHMIRFETGRAHRFWIIHAPENHASLRGIRKTGFQYVGKLYTRQQITTIEDTPASRHLEPVLSDMGISVSPEAPSSCWNCSSPYLKQFDNNCCCRTAGAECVGSRFAATVME